MKSHLKILIFLAILSLSTISAITFPYTVEAEECKGYMEVYTSKWEEINGEFSGKGFVYLREGNFSFEVTLEQDGIYQINSRLAQINQKEGRKQTISINGIEYSFKVPYYDSWTDFNFGLYRLNKGKNVIAVLGKYGYAEYDTFTISEPIFPDLKKVSSKLSDPKATPETKKLFEYLISVYGKNIISGQQEVNGGWINGDYELEFEYIHNVTGKYPAIRGFDFMDFNPLYYWNDKTAERIIEWVKGRGGIATASWHIVVPLDFTSYKLGERVKKENCTFRIESNFISENVIVKGTKENDYFNLAIKYLAEQLVRIQEYNIPIIFRPLHEAEGAWFWWGKAGAKVYVKLWKYLYQKLTVDYDLHNLIWEQNLYTWSNDSLKWYAGDDYVDIVGYDKYNTPIHSRHDGKSSGPNLDPETNIFYTLVDFVKNKKMISMAENDSIPGIDNLIIEKSAWLYFLSWHADCILDKSMNDPFDFNKIYNSDYCITLEKLPSFKE